MYLSIYLSISLYTYVYIKYIYMYIQHVRFPPRVCPVGRRSPQATAAP